MTFGSLFSGIGGLDLGLERAGMVCRWQVEVDPFCRRILEKHWPGMKRYGDIRQVTELEHVGGAGQPDGDNEELAYAWSERLQRISEAGSAAGPIVRGDESLLPAFAPGPSDPRWPDLLVRYPWLRPAISQAEIECELCGVADGPAPWLDPFASRRKRLAALGNAVVPACAEYVGIKITEMEPYL